MDIFEKFFDYTFQSLLGKENKVILKIRILTSVQFRNFYTYNNSAPGKFCVMEILEDLTKFRKQGDKQHSESSMFLHEYFWIFVCDHDWNQIYVQQPFHSMVGK